MALSLLIASEQLLNSAPSPASLLSLLAETAQSFGGSSAMTPPSSPPSSASSASSPSNSSSGTDSLASQGVHCFNNPTTAGDVVPTKEMLQNFLETCTKSWDPSWKAARFYANNDFISCVLWEGRYFVTGTDIVKFISWRFRMENEPQPEQKKFEEGIFSDLRNLKPGIDAVLEEPRSVFLEFLFKIGAIRTHKKQKVFFWHSVSFEKLFLEAARRAKKRDIDPVLDSLLALRAKEDRRESSGSPVSDRSTKRQRTGGEVARRSALFQEHRQQQQPATPPPSSSSSSSSSTGAVSSPLSHAVPFFPQSLYLSHHQQQPQQQPILPPLKMALSGLLDLKEAGASQALTELYTPVRIDSSPSHY